MLLRLPGVGNKIADKICRMREEGVQITRDNLINIPYLAHSPELFEMIDYTTITKKNNRLLVFTSDNLSGNVCSSISIPPSSGYVLKGKQN
jgi:predicted DNA-binding helix-hairpin-helix protein